MQIGANVKHVENRIVKERNLTAKRLKGHQLKPQPETEKQRAETETMSRGKWSTKGTE
jgi:hypothetical protein